MPNEKQRTDNNQCYSPFHRLTPAFFPAPQMLCPFHESSADIFRIKLLRRQHAQLSFGTLFYGLQFFFSFIYIYKDDGTFEVLVS